MRQGRLHARLDRLLLATRKHGRIVIIFPERWSAAAQAAYDEATRSGDREGRAAIIRPETGEGEDWDDSSLISVIEVRTRDDGPA